MLVKNSDNFGRNSDKYRTESGTKKSDGTRTGIGRKMKQKLERNSEIIRKKIENLFIYFEPHFVWNSDGFRMNFGSESQLIGWISEGNRKKIEWISDEFRRKNRNLSDVNRANRGRFGRGSDYEIISICVRSDEKKSDANFLGRKSYMYRCPIG